MDEEYLKLFKNTQNDEYQSLNEKPNYGQFERQRINETPDVSMYRIDENLNDGWGSTLDIQIETRVNGVPMQQNPYYNPVQKRAQRLHEDLNGLGQYLNDDDNINEVYRQPVMQPVQEQIVTVTQGPMEDIRDVDVVSVELFNRLNEKAFQPIVAKTSAFQYLQS